MSWTRAAWERMRPFQTQFVIVAVFVTGFILGSQYTVGSAQGDTAPPPDAKEAFEPFWQVYNLIQRTYLDRDTLDQTKLVDGAIRGMIDTLEDPFTGYMDAAQYPTMRNDLSGEFEGIGAVVETIEDSGEIRIATVLEGSPAEAAGLQGGDIFVSVDGEDVTQISQFDLVTKVRGPEGTTVRLTMRRGDSLIDFSIIRKRMEIETVESKKLNDSIGYLKLREFNSNAYDQLQAALAALEVNNLEGLVLDLRGNPGGFLTSAIDVASMFLKEGNVVIEDFGGGEQERLDVNPERYIGVSVPLVVLVDENSASASELVAGALQDQERATIVGTTTFGKGTVQTWSGLVNGAGVRITIARWLTPNGNWIHEQGITPDIVVENGADPHSTTSEDPQLDAAIQILEQTPVK